MRTQKESLSPRRRKVGKQVGSLLYSIYNLFRLRVMYLLRKMYFRFISQQLREMTYVIEAKSRLNKSRSKPLKEHNVSSTPLPSHNKTLVSNQLLYTFTKVHNCFIRMWTTKSTHLKVFYPKLHSNSSETSEK